MDAPAIREHPAEDPLQMEAGLEAAVFGKQEPSMDTLSHVVTTVTTLGTRVDTLEKHIVPKTGNEMPQPAQPSPPSTQRGGSIADLLF